MRSVHIQTAAQNLRPGKVAYAEDTYESVRWRCDDPPTKKELETEAELVSVSVAFETLRTRRTQLHARSDWTQIADAPVNAEAWAKYRQKLRDLPATIEDPTATIVWPTPPA